MIHEGSAVRWNFETGQEQMMKEHQDKGENKT